MKDLIVQEVKGKIRTVQHVINHFSEPGLNKQASASGHNVYLRGAIKRLKNSASGSMFTNGKPGVGAELKPGTAGSKKKLLDEGKNRVLQQLKKDKIR
jgi:hypothetical protein